MEVAEFEDPEKCVLGFAVVMPESWKPMRARALLAKICDEIDRTSFARVMMEDTELVPVQF
jgi:hypothetical protein